MSKLPDEWEKGKLLDIASSTYGMVDGPFGSNLSSSEYTESGIPVIRGSNLSLGTHYFKDNGFVFVSPEKANELIRSNCVADDIIFTKKGTLGQTGIIPRQPKYARYILSSNQMKLTVNQDLADPYYVYHYVSSPWSIEKILNDSSSTGVPQINLAYLRTFPIHLPPLEEQRKIAAILSTWDEAIGLVEQLIAVLGRRKQALMQLLLTGAVRFAGFEEEWEETELKEVVTMLSGGTPSKENSDYWNGDIPWISAKSMHSIYVSDSEDKITLEGARNGSRLVPAETVLILVRGSMLFKRIPVCLTTREVAFNQDLKALISRGKISPTFLLYSLIAQENQILSQIEITGMGAGKISSDILSLMPISIPPRNEQNKISETLKLCDDELDTLREYSGTLREQKRGLMQQLLTGAVRV